MSDAQVICSVKDVIDKIDSSIGEEKGMMQTILETSQWIMLHVGAGIPILPVLETRVIAASNEHSIKIGPALDILSVTENLAEITDYTKDPLYGVWRKGPCTHLQRNDHGVWNVDITISAWWGLYLDIKPMGISASQATNSETTLVTTNGGILSPGMVLKLGDEAELVTAGNGGPGSPPATPALSLVNEAIAANEAYITADNGAEFYEDEVIAIGTENIHLVKRFDHTWYVQRGWNDTNIADHADNSPIGVYRTYTVERGVNGSDAEIHANAPISRYLPPADVLYLAVQMVVLMRQKAKTMFGGKSGNSDTGEAWYVNEFPSQQIDKVKMNYWLPYL